MSLTFVMWVVYSLANQSRFIKGPFLLLFVHSNVLSSVSLIGIPFLRRVDDWQKKEESRKCPEKERHVNQFCQNLNSLS